MFKKPHLLIFIIFLPSFLLAQVEIMEVIVEDNQAYFYHTNTERNCASEYIFELDENGYDLTLYEVDIDPLAAFCLCYFNLSTTLSELNSGDYHLHVYSLENFGQYYDTIFWSTLDFTIEGLFSSNQVQMENPYSSGCLDICPLPYPYKPVIDCYELFGFEWIYENMREILGYNLYLDGTLLAFIDNGINNFNYNLQAGIEYNFCLTTVCDFGESDPQCIEILLPDYLPPEELCAELINNQPLLEWQSPAVDPGFIIGYIVYRDGFPVSGSAPLSETSWLDESVEPGNTYTYAVSTVYHYCQSDPCESIAVDILTGFKIIHSENISVYPNPFTDAIQINCNFAVSELILTDLLGNQVIRKVLNGEQHIALATTQLTNGFYFLTLSNKITQKSISLIKSEP